MKAVSDEIDNKPLHPDTIPEVQEARATMQAAQLAALTAEQRHKTNWDVAQSAGDPFTARRAKIKARQLFDEMELYTVAAEETAQSIKRS